MSTPSFGPKPYPLTTIVLVGGPDVGARVSEGSTLKLELLVAVPELVVTAMGPVVVWGTVAVICTDEFTTNAADCPLKVTPVTLSNPLPLIVTDEPMAPEVGEKEEMCGSTV